MSTSVFSLLQKGGSIVYGLDLTTNGAAIKPGLLVIRDATGDTVSLAGATGSAPFGFAYGNRDLVYAPTTKTYANAEAVSVLSGSGLVAVSADFFSSGSLPAEIAGQNSVFAAASGLLNNNLTGANQIGRIINLTTMTDGTGGTGASVQVAIIQFDFGIAG